LKINDGAALTITDSNTITVTNSVEVAATGLFSIENNASLVQINAVSNIGNISYKRTAYVRNLDYVYWSSPVSNMIIDNIAAPLALGALYKWNTTIYNTNGSQGDWESASGEVMSPGGGYIALAPASFSASTPSDLNATFIGVPNNGTIPTPIHRGTYIDTNYFQGINGIEITNYEDNWNLIGNPYPSPIRASQFLLDNQSKIEGNVRLWTHGTLPTNTIPNPFYASFNVNYTSNDYLTYNFTGTNCCPLAPADLFIGAGQGFFVQMKDGQAASDVVTFNNGLRNKSYPNSNFYKSKNIVADSGSLVSTNMERNRIWLDIADSNGQSNRMLFGYIEGATMDYDSLFDTYAAESDPITLFTINNNEKYIIQGRALPFNVDDQVPLGAYLSEDGNFTIAIAAVDGLFHKQNIYLYDQVLNIIHNLKTEPYHFFSNAGTINNRFKIVYTDNTLNTTNFELDSSIQFNVNAHINIKSTKYQLKEVIVYDLLGRKLKEYKNLNHKEISLHDFYRTQTTLIIKVKLETGEYINRKIIF
jgi:hypothetical protein